MTAKERKDLNEQVGRVVMMYYDPKDGYDADANRDKAFVPDGWNPTEDDNQLRQVKERLVELGLSFEEIIRNEHVPAHRVFRVYRGVQEVVISNYSDTLKGYTIQELGCLVAVEAVEKLKGAASE